MNSKKLCVLVVTADTIPNQSIGTALISGSHEIVAAIDDADAFGKLRSKSKHFDLLVVCNAKPLATSEMLIVYSKTTFPKLPVIWINSMAENTTIQARSKKYKVDVLLENPVGAAEFMELLQGFAKK